MQQKKLSYNNKFDIIIHKFICIKVTGNIAKVIAKVSVDFAIEIER